MYGNCSSIDQLTLIEDITCTGLNTRTVHMHEIKVILLEGQRAHSVPAGAT